MFAPRPLGEMLRRVADLLLFPFLLFLTITGFYWRLVLTREFDWIWGPDLTNELLPWFQSQAVHCREEFFPLWDPHSFGGQPYLGLAQPGAAYPLNWLLFLARLDHGKINPVALEWYFVIIHYLAALFCYL